MTTTFSNEFRKKQNPPRVDTATYLEGSSYSSVNVAPSQRLCGADVLQDISVCVGAEGGRTEIDKHALYRAATQLQLLVNKSQQMRPMLVPVTRQPKQEVVQTLPVSRVFYLSYPKFAGAKRMMVS